MNLPYVLRYADRLYARAPAVRDGGLSLTWREFAARVRRIAGGLSSLGAENGERLAVLMLNSPAFLDLYFAVPLTGAILTPLNTRWGMNEFTFTLNDCEAKLLVVDDRFAPIVDQLRASVPSIETVIFTGCGEAPDKAVAYHDLLECPEIAQGADPDEDDIAGLFYTSGTTGGPKGAMLTHRNLFSNALNVQSWLEPGLCWLHAAPMFHLADGGVLYALALAGGCHCFVETFEPEAVLSAIQRYRVTHMILVPTMLNMLTHHPSCGRYDLSSLKRITYGASPMPPAQLEAARAKLGCEFAQAYGMTEASPALTYLRSEENHGERAQSVGRAVPGVELRIVDERDRDLPAGQVGEIIARGPNVMKGYWGRPEVTREVLRGGWLHTGDMGAFDEDGYVYLYDRMKDMIKTGGENVYSPEIEGMLCTHPAVLEAAVIGIPHEKWGETISAVLAVKPGQRATEAEIIAWCRERLAHFKCPSSVVFLDALPKSGTGKVQKNVLRKMAVAAAV